MKTSEKERLASILFEDQKTKNFKMMIATATEADSELVSELAHKALLEKQNGHAKSFDNFKDFTNAKS